MNVKSLNLICDVIINSGKLTFIEISDDSIYLEFNDVELGQVKETEDTYLAVRFDCDSFISVFYNSIWDIDFLSKYNFKNRFLNADVSFDVVNIKFIDFEYLNTFFYNYQHEKTISKVPEFDIHNIRNDFFILVEAKDIAIVVGADQMDFYTKDEKLDDSSLKELSNQWMLNFLKYHLKRNIIKNPIYENHPLMRDYD